MKTPFVLALLLAGSGQAWTGPAAPTTTPPPAPTTTTPPEPLSTTPPRLLVLGLTRGEGVDGVDDDTLRGLEEAVAYEAGRYARIEVLSPADLRALGQLQALAQLTDCDDAAACADKMGLVAGTQKVISGSVRAVGDRVSINLQLFDVVNDHVDGRATQDSAKGAESLFAVVRSMVPALFGVAGVVRIWDQPAGGEVTLDGAPVGTTPVAEVAVRRPGRHEIAIVGPGLTRWSATLDVAAGTVVQLRARNRRIVDLESDELWYRGAGVVGGVVSVVAGAGSVIAFVAAADSDRALSRVDLRSANQAQLDAITSTTTTATVVGAGLAVVAVAGLAGSGALYLWNPATSALGAE